MTHPQEGPEPLKLIDAEERERWRNVTFVQGYDHISAELFLRALATLDASEAAHADTIAELVELQNEYMAVAPFRDAFHGLQREAGDLRSTLFEQEQEITRHHRDFTQWEAMAAKGAAQIERAKAVDVLLPVAEMYLDAFSDDDRMTWVEAFRYTEVRDTVAALRAKEDA